MAVYGRTIYGADFYGPDQTSLLASNPVAAPSGFGTVRVTWNNPGGTWERLRLVRGAYGYPTTADDGTVLLDVNCGPNATGTVVPAVNSYLDSGLTAPRVYYYSLFVLQAIGAALVWTKTGDVEGQSVLDHSYTSFLLERLTGVATSSDSSVSGQADQSSTLGKFLSIIGFDLSRFRDLLEGVALSRSADEVDGKMLPYLADMLGYTYEPTIGMRQNRILLRNAAYLNSIKGTADGITGFASALTGYGATLLAPTNLLLAQDDASATNTIGNWVAAGGTLTRSTAYTDVPDSDGASFLMSCTGAATVTCGSADPVRQAIPVTAGTSYTMTFYRATKDTPTTQSACSVVWYDASGTQLSVSDDSISLGTAATSWGRTSDAVFTAPTGAAYAAPRIRFPSATAGTFANFDAVQFEQASASSAFAPPRQLRVSMTAARVNEVPNGGFDTDTVGWNANYATLAWNSTTTYDGGLGSCQVTPSSPAVAVWPANVTTITGGLNYVIAAQVYGTGNYTISVTWLDASSTQLRIDTSTAQAGSGSGWTRIGFTDGSGNLTSLVAPAGATTITMTIRNDATAAWYLDDVLVEATSVLKPYFDTRHEPGDVKYEDGTTHTRTHYYPNYLARSSRLQDLMAKQVPLGSTYTILYAQPD